MDKPRVDWQTALVGVCTVVLTLLGTGTQISPVEGTQKQIIDKLLELSETNRALNKMILESVTDSHALNLEMLKVVADRRDLFKEMMDKLGALEKRLPK